MTSFFKNLGFKKEKVIPQDLGDYLYSLALNWALRDAKNKDFLKLVLAENIDENYLIRELIVLNMYAIISVCDALLKNGEFKDSILNSMHIAYYIFLGEHLGLEEKEIENHRLFLNFRYNEYEDSRKEKRGPNELWPLSHHILKNLHRKEKIEEEPLDAVTMTNVMKYYGSLVDLIHKVLRNNKLVK
jgi:hypothetical protein